MVLQVKVLPMLAWLTLHVYADLDGVMPTHVQDLLPIPKQLTRGAFCIAAMQAHSYFRNDTWWSPKRLSLGAVQGDDLGQDWWLI